MKKNTFYIIAVMIIVAVAMNACTTPTSAPTTAVVEAPVTTEVPAAATAEPTKPIKVDKINILLNYTIDGQHAPFFVAKEKGFFSKRNIEVSEILKGQGSSDTVNKVIAGVADVGFTHTVPIIQAIAQDQPIKIVMGFYTNELCELFSTAKTINIKTIEDLAALAATRSVSYGGASTGICYQLLPALAETTGTDLSNVESVNVAADARIALMATGQLDVAGTYYTGETAFRKGIEEVGDELVTMRYDQYINPYGNSIIVNTILLEQRPDLIQGIVSALLEGLEYTVENPEEAEQIMLKYQPQLDHDFNHDSLTKMVEEAIWDETTKSEGLGILNDKKMDMTIEMISKFWTLPRTPVLDEVFTNEFIIAAHEELGQ